MLEFFVISLLLTVNLSSEVNWVNIEDTNEANDVIFDEVMVEIDGCIVKGEREEDFKERIELTIDENEENIDINNSKKYSYKDAMNALDVVQSYVKSYDINMESISAVGKVRFDIQSHYMKKPKSTKSILSSFGRIISN